MIKIKGPRFAEGGHPVCLTVRNVGPGFSVHAVSTESDVVVSITMDPHNGTAQVCFVAPPAGNIVTIRVGDSSGRENATHAVITK